MNLVKRNGAERLLRKRKETVWLPCFTPDKRIISSDGLKAAVFHDEDEEDHVGSSAPTFSFVAFVHLLQHVVFQS